MASSLYVTVMLSYLLQTGRRFYHRSSWNDPFRNIAIFSIIILNCIYWISSIHMLYRKDGQPYMSTCILAAVFWMISLIFSFFYAFNPVLATHFGNRQANEFDNNDKKNTVNKNECQEVDMNSLNSLNEISITTNIKDFQLCRINSTNTSVGLCNSIDLILRICLVIIYGIPPSPKILEFLSQKILKNNKNNSLTLLEILTTSITNNGMNLDMTKVGHRSSSCNHQDRQLIEIKRKGRPITQCDHCRELRKTHKIHVKCNCKERATNMSTSLDDTSFSNTVDELLNPCQCTTGAKCVCYDPVDDDSSLIENNYSTTHGDSATNSLPSIPSYNQPVVPKKPENCNQPIVPLVFGYRDSSAVFTRSSQSCPSAMASGSCCSTSATESVCRCGTGCNCEGCGTHSLTITPMRPVKNCCSNDSRVVSQYENEIDNDETLMERDVTS
ncbi:28082_t:CDS:2, partial [Gigaspora margarita]